MLHLLSYAFGNKEFDLLCSLVQYARRTLKARDCIGRSGLLLSNIPDVEKTFENLLYTRLGHRIHYFVILILFVQIVWYPSGNTRIDGSLYNL
jgi:hypothetical protein